MRRATLTERLQDTRPSDNFIDYGSASWTDPRLLYGHVVSNNQRLGMAFDDTLQGLGSTLDDALNGRLFQPGGMFGQSLDTIDWGPPKMVRQDQKPSLREALLQLYGGR